MNELTTVQFNNTNLIAMTRDDPGNPLIAMRPIFDDIGVPWHGQYQRLTSHPAICPLIIRAQLPGEDRARDHVFLPLEDIDFALATLHPNRVKDPAMRATIILYQKEAKKALYAHFRKPPDLESPRMTKGEVARLMAAIVHKQVAESEERMTAKAAELEAKVMAIANGFDKTRFSILGFRPAVRVLDDLQVPSKGRRGLSQRCSSAMRNWADATDRFKDKQRSDETNTWLFHVDLIRDWLKAEGSALIQNFKDEKKGQTVMPFMVVNNTEPKSDDK